MASAVSNKQPGSCKHFLRSPSRPCSRLKTGVTVACVVLSRLYEIMTEENSRKRKMREGSLIGSCSADDSGKSEDSLCILSSHDFAKIRYTHTFVDKTPFVKSFLSDTSRVVLLTAPRAFGKSTLMNMTKQFLLGKTSLFEGLKIYNDNKQFFAQHCIPHPVIHIDLGGVRGKSFDKVKEKLALAVNAAFREHGYLVKKTDDDKLKWASKKLRDDVSINLRTFEKYFDSEKCTELSTARLEQSIKYLSEILYKHYEKKTFILIDEYDAPAVGLIFKTDFNKDDPRSIHDLLTNFMATTLKFNEFMERSLMFACVRLAGALSGDAARVIRHYPFLSAARYAPYFGFTEEEVKQLLERPQLKHKHISWSLEQIREWYDGYSVPESNLKIYSSWSVLNHLERSIESKNLQFSCYWIETGCVRNLETLFTLPLLRKKIEEATEIGGKIKINMVDSVSFEHLKVLKELINLNDVDNLSDNIIDLFLQFMADCGYFNVLQADELEQQPCSSDKKNKTQIQSMADELEQQPCSSDKKNETQIQSTKSCILEVPNFEIRQYLKSICHQTTTLAIIKKYNLTRGDVNTYIEALKSVLENPSEKAFVDLANAVAALFSRPQQMITNEDEFRSVLYALARDSQYFILLVKSEEQLEKKRKKPGKAPTIDLIILMKNKNNGIILELKVDSKSADEALDQIYKKGYHTKLQEFKYSHISKKIYAGLTFNTSEKKVSITYKVGNEDGTSVSSE